MDGARRYGLELAQDLDRCFSRAEQKVGKGKAILEVQRVGTFIPANVENPPVTEVAACLAQPGP